MTSTYQTRVIVRDVSGKYCWDSAILYGGNKPYEHVESTLPLSGMFLSVGDERSGAPEVCTIVPTLAFSLQSMGYVRVHCVTGF